MKKPLLALLGLVSLLVATSFIVKPKRTPVAAKARVRLADLQSYRLADLAATCSCNAVFGNRASRGEWSEMASQLVEESEASERLETATVEAVERR